MSQQHEGWNQHISAGRPQTHPAIAVDRTPDPLAAAKRRRPWVVGVVAAIAVIGGIITAVSMSTVPTGGSGTVAVGSGATVFRTHPSVAVAAGTGQASGGVTVEQVDYGRTAAEQNAISKAKDYLAYTAFSRSGLIGQLKYEGFAEADATYAVDSLTVDWNAQAVKKAKEYLDYTSFSHSGLVEQLEYEGFTAAQAEYGTRGAGL